MYKHYVEDAVDTRILGVMNSITIGEIFKDFEICRVFSRFLICFYEFTPCDTNSSELLPLCPERFQEFDRLFETCGKLLNIFIRSYINWSNPRTYYPQAKVAVSKTSCSKSSKCINYK